MSDPREETTIVALQRTTWILSPILAVLALIQTAAAAGAEVRAGFAERDITPDIGMEQPGGYGKSFHRSLHDPCKVRAVVFDDGANRVALVGVDALAVPRQLVLDCRRAIRESCGIPENAVMIAASHSHSSGPTAMVQPGEYDGASELVQRLAYKESSTADPNYLERVRSAIVDAVGVANQSRSSVDCGFGSGLENQVAFNRRFRMKNGLTYTHPGQGNPDIASVAGPTDPEVGVVGVWNRQSRLAGCVVNFACHATTSPGGISANYVYYLEKVIRGAMGSDAVVVFTAGACGDVTQVDNLSPFDLRAGERSAEFVGGRVGAEAVKTLLTMDRTAQFRVDASAKILRIPRRAPRSERVEEARKIVEGQLTPPDPAEKTFAKETLMLQAKLVAEPVAEVEIQALQIGPVVFVGNPAEYFCQLGLDIKKGSRFPLTYPVSLANGCVGYVPTEEALGPHGGGYETRLTSYSNLIPSAGTTIADECIKLTQQLNAGMIPTAKPHRPFSGRGWSYGNVPAQVD